MLRMKFKNITYYDKREKRYKQVDIGHAHAVNSVSTEPHTHKGYKHDEKGTYSVSKKESNMIERVLKTWYCHINRE